MQSALSTTSQLAGGAATQLSSRSQATRRCFTPTATRGTPKRAIAPTTRALFSKKDSGGGKAKKPMSVGNGKNLIKPKPLYAKGDEPWYIDPATGKAPGYLQLTAFMGSQLFVGIVMVPFSIWWQQVFDPIINK